MDLSGDGLLGIGKEIRHGGCLGNKYNAYEATGWKMENALDGPLQRSCSDKGLIPGQKVVFEYEIFKDMYLI